MCRLLNGKPQEEPGCMHVRAERPRKGQLNAPVDRPREDTIGCTHIRTGKYREGQLRCDVRAQGRRDGMVHGKVRMRT